MAPELYTACLYSSTKGIVTIQPGSLEDFNAHFMRSLPITSPNREYPLNSTITKAEAISDKTTSSTHQRGENVFWISEPMLFLWCVCSDFPHIPGPTNARRGAASRFPVKPSDRAAFWIRLKQEVLLSESESQGVLLQAVMLCSCSRGEQSKTQDRNAV